MCCGGRSVVNRWSAAVRGRGGEDYGDRRWKSGSSDLSSLSTERHSSDWRRPSGRCSPLSHRGTANVSPRTCWRNRSGPRARLRRPARHCTGASCGSAASWGSRRSSRAAAVIDWILDTSRSMPITSADSSVTPRAIRRLDPDDAVGLLHQAGAAFRGDPYADVPETALPAGELPRLQELRLAIVEEGFEAQLASGDGHRCIADLESFVESNPFRERAWAHLMLALVSGRARGRRARRLRAGGGSCWRPNSGSSPGPGYAISSARS